MKNTTDLRKRFSLPLLGGLLFLFCSVNAQPIVNSWTMNNTVMAKYYLQSGSPPNYTYTLTTLTDAADVQMVCYTTDSVWVQTTGLAEVMGPYLNPGTPTNQNFVWRLPRNPHVATTSVAVPNVFAIGSLLNGVAVFGNSDATSYNPQSNSNVNNGAHLWNVDAWYGEGFTLDTLYGAHVNQGGTYHTHATPYHLYSDDSTQHSPLIGFAFDGYPIYGPYGYSTATNSSSGTRRMKSSYKLRSITQRTTLPNGNTSTPPGPNVSATFPLGMYIEDYSYQSGLGDLDNHGGRYCVTPEYPGGTYAYFISVTPTGAPYFPYYLGDTFYGEVEQANLNVMSTSGISMPSSSSGCITPAGIETAQAPATFELFPNPTDGEVIITLNGLEAKTTTLQVIDVLGRTVLTKAMTSEQEVLDLGALTPGVYSLLLTDRATGKTGHSKVVRN